MAVVARDHYKPPGQPCLVKEGGKHRYRIPGPARIELFPLQQLVVDGIDDDTDNASVRRCDLLPNFTGEHGISLAAEGRFVEDNREKAALAVSPQPGVRLKAGLLVGRRSLPQQTAEEARPRRLARTRRLAALAASTGLI